MFSEIPPTAQALDEALELSAEILKDIELIQIPLATIALKTSRLARLLNDFEAQRIFQFEASGYTSTPEGIPPDVWKLIERSGRTFQQKDQNSKTGRTVAFTESLGQLEEAITAAKIGLEAARDRDVSVSSANPEQFVMAPIGNILERQRLQTQISTAVQRLANRRAYIYDYVSRRHYELKFSGIVQDVFAKVREAVDKDVAQVVPSAVQKFTAVHDNLRSKNPEDWSNAVHSCRRILQDLADAVYPPQTEERIVKEGNKEIHIRLGSDNYINRLVCFAEGNSTSDRFKEIVGSHLRFLGERLDAIFGATQKGSHSIVSHEEANRYVIYTYMLVGDILSLRSNINEVRT